MKASIQKSDLLRAIQTAERAVFTKSSLPILSSLALEVSGETLKVQATDLEISIQSQVEIDSGEDGCAAVPGKQLVDYVKAMPGPVVNLSVDKGTMLVQSGRSRYKLQVVGSREEFPVLPEVKPDMSFVAAEKALAEALGRTVIAASEEDPRPVLCSLLWKLKDGVQTLAIVSTDTHRLHASACPIQSTSGTADVLVPVRACRELVRLLSGEQECRVILDNNQIQVQMESGTLISRRMEGNYPDFAKVVPDYKNHVSVNRDDLAAVLNRIGVVARDASGRVTLEFEDGKPIRITADAGDQGAAEDEVAVEGNLNAEQVRKVAVNWRYLLQAVQACPDECIRFFHESGSRPFLLHGADKNQFSATIMPMSLP